MAKIIKEDAWEALRRFTQARIALGRSGSSIPIKKELAFKLAHAHARDAVHSVMNIEVLAEGFGVMGLPVLNLHSQAENRQIYLQRPDLGRLPDQKSVQMIRKFAAPNDISLIVADGLSANAINRNLFPLMLELLRKLGGLRLAPVSIVSQGRVAIGDHIGHGLKSKLSIVLIGERPGLTATDSIGAYLTYDPKPGLTDESRNCISNIRPDGLDFQEAATKISYLVKEAFQLKLSGVKLKDNDSGNNNIILE